MKVYVVTASTYNGAESPPELYQSLDGAFAAMQKLRADTLGEDVEWLRSSTCASFPTLAGSSWDHVRFDLVEVLP